jgi:molybdopterin biosynthesis enzyme
VPLGIQCSSLVSASADANALIIVPPSMAGYRARDRVDVDVLDWNAVAFAY